MSLALSRVEIESAGSDPRKLARALLAQLPAVTGPVPIEAIARALDIVSIEVAPLSGIEGCLQCDPLKSEGQIVVNANSPPRRRRYTIAHELGHFLNERHRPTIDLGFACTADDMAKPRRTGRASAAGDGSQHLRHRGADAAVRPRQIPAAAGRARPRACAGGGVRDQPRSRDPALCRFAGRVPRGGVLQGRPGSLHREGRGLPGHDRVDRRSAERHAAAGARRARSPRSTRPTPSGGCGGRTASRSSRRRSTRPTASPSRCWSRSGTGATDADVRRWPDAASQVARSTPANTLIGDGELP